MATDRFRRLVLVVAIGAVAHECAHYLAARAVGARPTLQLDRPSPRVVVAWDERPSLAALTAVQVAPTLVGTAAVGAAMLALSPPHSASGMIALAWGVGNLAVLTLPSRGDLRPLREHRKEWREGGGRSPPQSSQ